MSNEKWWKIIPPVAFRDYARQMGLIVTNHFFYHSVHRANRYLTNYRNNPIHCITMLMIQICSFSTSRPVWMLLKDIVWSSRLCLCLYFGVFFICYRIIGYYLCVHLFISYWYDLLICWFSNFTFYFESVFFVLLCWIHVPLLDV
jgi:hypothetical protein